jgi:ferredoxin
MGHLSGKDVYGELGAKVDALHVRAPVNETFYEILKALYSTEEAQVVVQMPFLFSSLDRVSKITKVEKGKLEQILKGLCARGLVMDVWLGGEYRYMPSPLFVGIFEFTMMRADGDPNMKRWAELFHEYMEEGSPYRGNFSPQSRVSIARALPHEETLADHVEILDYEKATALIEGATRFAVGTCSCRHKKDHAGEERCQVPLGTCTTLNHGADYLIRNGLSKEISRTEMLEIFSRSKELGLVFSADNVRKRIMFVCHCCGCCCGIMDGINKHGLTTTLVTSSFLAKVNAQSCIGCGMCAEACHVNAIEMVPDKGSENPKAKIPHIDHTFCVGCGVCALKCKTKAISLEKREKRVLHPETTFERVILQCLERGTLQNQLFDNPQSLTHKVMRGVVGGFLKLSPVKRALMTDTLRSTFLNSLGAGVKFLGKGYIHEL